jgi:hypothetical protein
MAITEIAALPRVKRHLRLPNPDAPSAEDSTIQFLMDAATRAIEVEVGHVVKKKVTGELHDGGHLEVWLRQKPVLDVVSVQEGWGYLDQELDFQQVNTVPALSIYAYSLDDPASGLITRRAGGNVNTPFIPGRNNIRVSYHAGREQLPANAALAFCELVGVWYRQGQQRTAQAGQTGMIFNQLNQDFTKSAGVTSINLGVPDAIIQMLKPDRRDPIIA